MFRKVSTGFHEFIVRLGSFGASASVAAFSLLWSVGEVVQAGKRG